ncbi:TetR/AcrR family transcriptional regulator [Halomarina salina]|uniref:TetR/AcrR family transcriptional regulator n=1 Tax=Halomarina salina TaxID=1872699 RepID=A0ABD5RL65_9EURY|nr:TetR/AcrR family transcriptional regulator [Halomarina salina]
MRSFSDDERSRIRQQIRETGRDLFSRYGLRKTTISELTEPAGIASSTFYQFYDSKEELYIELLEEEGEETTEHLLAISFERYDDPQAAIEAFLLGILEVIETNQLVRQIIVSDELDRLREQFTDEEMEENRQQELAIFLPYLEAWDEAGLLHDVSPELLAYTIHAIIFVGLHEDEIPMYQEVKQTLVGSFARGVTSDDPDLDAVDVPDVDVDDLVASASGGDRDTAASGLDDDATDGQ